MNAHILPGTEAGELPVIVVGAGLAGALVALALAPLPVLLLAPPAAAASALAQGGIAAAVGAGDGSDLHARDTLAAGAGLGEPEAVARITAAGPAVIAGLEALGIPFDRTADGALALGLEAAHSRARIVHAGGDATGRIVLEGLLRALDGASHVRRLATLRAVRLDAADGAVQGLWAGDGAGRAVHLPARAVVLATGGLGGLYGATTNPPSALGQGLAMAARAGAVLRDLEFVQFHPTAIAVDGDPLPLATEALRGAGAILVNDLGHRFMAEVPGRELAPRDVVARAIHGEITAGRSVFLDARECLGSAFAARFPSVDALCRRAGLDPAEAAIPVRPAAHYHMGGIAVDGRGRSSLDRLYASGEVASTGLHGANRLASNSLLEALACAPAIAEDIKGRSSPPKRAPRTDAPARRPPADLPGLRRIMDRHVGVVRIRPGLEAALDALWPAAETDDAALVAALVALAALDRTESRGGHFRADHPAPHPEARHSHITLAEARRTLGAARVPLPEPAR